MQQMLQKHQQTGETLWNILLNCHYLQKLAVLVLLGAPLCQWEALTKNCSRDWEKSEGPECSPS